MQLLNQDLITIVPYVRAQDRGQALYQAWRMVEQSGDTSALFWNMTEPEAIKGDLVFFARYFTSDDRQLFFLLNQEASEWVGLAWVEDIRQGQQAFFSFFVRPESRGAVGLAALQQTAQTVLDTYQLQQLWALTPWKAAKRLAAWAGFETVATLPQYANGRDVFLLQKVRSIHG